MWCGFITALALGLVAAGADVKPGVVACVGKGTAPVGVLYLHGIDPVEPSGQELQNRRLLTQLSIELGFDLAILRSKTRCDVPPFQGKLCWPRSTSEAIAATLTGVLAAGGICIAKHARRLVVGFSNGGYLLHHAVMHCAASGAARYVTIGAAGILEPPASPAYKDCGTLDLMIGRQDLKYRQAKVFADQLSRIGRLVRVTEFDGGHMIPEDPIRAVLARLVLGPSGEIEHCDIPGAELSRPNAKDLGSCRAACKSDHRCAAFVFTKAKHACELKMRLTRVLRETPRVAARQPTGACGLGPASD